MCCILLLFSPALWMLCKCQTMFSSFYQNLSTVLSLPCIYHLCVLWSSWKEKSHPQHCMNSLFLLLLPPTDSFHFNHLYSFKLLILMTSFKIFIHGQKPEKNIPASIHTSCHYSFRFAKFFHQNKLLPLSSANLKKRSPLGAHLFCEMLSWMCLYSVLSQKWKESFRSFISEKSWTLLSVVRQREGKKPINFFVKMFMMQHMGSFVYKSLSVPLNTLAYNIYFQLQSCYLTGYNHPSPPFHLTKKCSVRKHPYVATREKETQLKDNHNNPQSRQFKTLFSSGAET